MSQVPLIRTVISTREYARAAINAWRFLYRNVNPTKAQIGVLYAQWQVETSGKNCWNWNIGNKKVSQGQVDAGVPWFDLPGTWEIINGQRVVLKEGDPGRRFRAYSSLEAGMSEHLDALRIRWSRCWPHVLSGNPDGFAHALKAGRDGVEGTWDDYFTAPVKDYADIMTAAFNGWMRSSSFEDAMDDIAMASEEVTKPSIVLGDLPEFTIVHKSPFSDDDEPPPQAA
jgi:hypothetical protein